jgi:SagB-type dehydrogenase family enzyme
LSQSWIAQAPALIVIGGVYGRTSIKYGERATRYVHMEAGNANQNLYLQAESLGVNLGTVGAFNDGLLSQVLKLPDPVAPLLVVALGR